jgi:hypothetical protein
MTKKMFIISLIVIIVIGVGVFGVLFFVKKGSTPQASVDTSPKPGDAVALSETPEYKACEFITAPSVKSALGEGISNFSDATRNGVVAQNYEVAETCDYSFSTVKSDENTASIRIVKASLDPSKQVSQDPPTWVGVNSADYPEYKINSQAKYETIESSDTIQFVLTLLDGPKEYLFIIAQPKDAATFDKDTAASALIKMANVANLDMTRKTTPPTS